MAHNMDYVLSVAHEALEMALRLYSWHNASIHGTQRYRTGTERYIDSTRHSLDGTETPLQAL